ncbi:MAG TPA: RIP metalloprotease RseP [Polyangia bacterium]
MLSFVLAIFGLALLIVLHEGGHFLVARLCGMRVERFSVGFGPPLASFKRGGTIFQVAPIPLGGFVQITGLNPSEEFDKSDPMVYPNRPRWMRLLTVVAGPAANYLTAIVMVFVVLMAYGTTPKTQQIDDAVTNRPAAAAGLKAGDVLVEANGQKVDADHLISEVIKASQGAPVNIKVLRSGQPMEFSVKPDLNKGVYQVGIQIGPHGDRTPASIGVAAKEAVVYPYYASVDILDGLYNMIRGKVSAELSGPVGITQQIAKAASKGMVYFLSMLAMLSVYLGLFNLLPLPALDGGRAVFLGLESILRKRVDPRIEAAVHTAGFVLLMGVLLVVSWKDIRNLIWKV